jgi:putative ABC transport system permease protein
MYNLESIRYVFPASLVAGACLSVTAIILLTTLASIYKELLEVPAQLMRPKAAKAGKKILLERIPWIWKKVSFMHKVTIPNLFRYKKRFLMTVIGISGCSALLVAGFGLNDSISDIVPSQYSNIYHYDATVSADSEKNPDLKKQLENLQGIKEVYELQDMSVTVNYDDKDVSATVNIVDSPADFEEFMTFYDMDSSKTLTLDNSGVLLSIKTAEKMNLSKGDMLTFETLDGQEVNVPVAGIFEQYIGHQIYMTKDLFDSLGINEEPSSLYLLENDSTDTEFESELGSEIMNLEGVSSLTFYSSLQENFLNMISSIKLVVVVLVLSAAMLAFVVLYNLSNVNISERMREIATIKVLGFREKEVNAYVNRETILLALIGSLAGLVLGIYLHHMIMSLAELDTVRFGRTILWQSYAYSVALTMLFTFIINWVMKFKLRKIMMVESLKAVE